MKLIETFPNIYAFKAQSPKERGFICNVTEIFAAFGEYIIVIDFERAIIAPKFVMKQSQMPAQEISKIMTGLLDPPP